MYRFRDDDSDDQALPPPLMPPADGVDVVAPEDLAAHLQGMGLSESTRLDILGALNSVQQGILEHTQEYLEVSSENQEDGFDLPAFYADIFQLSNPEARQTTVSSGNDQVLLPAVVLGSVPSDDFSRVGTEQESNPTLYCSPNNYVPARSFGEDLGVPSSNASSPNIYIPVKSFGEDLEVPSANTSKPPHRKPYVYTHDSEQVLEVVKLVVRFPRLIFGAILAICLGVTVALYFSVLSKGNPFSALGLEMDLKDIRSIHYDSLNMARYETINARNAARTSLVARPAPRQSEVVGSTYWVFEAHNARGVFSDAQSIASMKDTFDIFYEDEGFQESCLLNAEARCDPPLSPLRMYYASSWDSIKVQTVIDDLKDPKNVDKFNSLGWCYAYDLNCDMAPTNVAQQDIDFVRRLNEDVNSIMDSWDMNGELIADHDQATELAAYLMQTEIFKPAVDFGYDKGFGVDNLVSQFSRGILTWGGPVKNDEGLLPRERIRR